MVIAWIVVSLLLGYAVAACMLTPSISKLRDEYDQTRERYSQSTTLLSRTGLFVNEWHFRIVCHRKSIIGMVFICWLILTTALVLF